MLLLLNKHSIFYLLLLNMVYFKLEWNVYGIHISLLVSHFDFCVKLTSDPSTRKTSLTYGHYSAAAVAGALVSGLVGCWVTWKSHLQVHILNIFNLKHITYSHTLTFFSTGTYVLVGYSFLSLFHINHTTIIPNFCFFSGEWEIVDLCRTNLSVNSFCTFKDPFSFFLLTEALASSAACWCLLCLVAHIYLGHCKAFTLVFLETFAFFHTYISQLYTKQVQFQTTTMKHTSHEPLGFPVPMKLCLHHTLSIKRDSMSKNQCRCLKNTLLPRTADIIWHRRVATDLQFIQNPVCSKHNKLKQENKVCYACI